MDTADTALATAFVEVRAAMDALPEDLSRADKLLEDFSKKDLARNVAHEAAMNAAENWHHMIADNKASPEEMRAAALQMLKMGLLAGIITQQQYLDQLASVDAAIASVSGKEELRAQREAKRQQLQAQQTAIGKQITQDNLTDQERYAQSVQQLDKLLHRNKITQETYNRALEKTKLAYHETTKAGTAMLANLKQQALALLPVITLGAAIAKIRSELHASASAFATQEEADARLGAVLGATDYAAGIGQDELQGIAAKMQNTTGIGSATVEQAMATMLRFKNVQGDTFRQAIALSEDLSVAMGRDLSTTATALGRALNQPGEALVQLSKLGITFTEDEKLMVRQMMATGRGAEAQAMILAKASQYAGAAMAAANNNQLTPLKILRERLGDVRIAIGEKLIPFQIIATRAAISFANAVYVLVSAAKAVITPFSIINNLTGGLAGELIMLSTVAVSVGMAFVAMQYAATQAIAWINAALVSSGWGNIVILIGLAIAAFVAFGSAIYKYSQVIASTTSFTNLWRIAVGKLQDAWRALEPIVLPILNAIGNMVNTIMEITGTGLGAAAVVVANFVLESAEWISLFVINWKMAFDFIQASMNSILDPAHAQEWATLAGQNFAGLMMKLDEIRGRRKGFVPKPTDFNEGKSEWSGFTTPQELSKKIQLSMLKEGDSVAEGVGQLVGLGKDANAMQKELLDHQKNNGLALAKP